MDELFKQEEVDKKLQSEQLNKMIVMTSPYTWIAIAGGILIVVAACIWGITARLPVSIRTEGILIEDQSLIENPEKTILAKQVICYVNLSEGKQITPGMKVCIYPSTVNEQECGHMEATVTQVEPSVTTEEQVLQRLGDEKLASLFTQGGPVVEVICSLREDAATSSGYYWSNAGGSTVTLSNDTLVEANIITQERAPISLILPYTNE